MPIACKRGDRKRCTVQSFLVVHVPAWVFKYDAAIFGRRLCVENHRKSRVVVRVPAVRLLMRHAMDVMCHHWRDCARQPTLGSKVQPREKALLGCTFLRYCGRSNPLAGPNASCCRPLPLPPRPRKNNRAQRGKTNRRKRTLWLPWTENHPVRKGS